MNPIQELEDDLFELGENPNRNTDPRASKPSRGASKEERNDWKNEKKSMKREKTERNTRRTEKRSY